MGPRASTLPPSSRGLDFVITAASMFQLASKQNNAKPWANFILPHAHIGYLTTLPETVSGVSLAVPVVSSVEHEL